MTSLKNNIAKDSEQQNRLDQRLVDNQKDIERCLDEIMRMDQTRSFDDREAEVKNVALKDQLLDMRRNFEDMSAKKEWAEAKLHEI